MSERTRTFVYQEGYDSGSVRMADDGAFVETGTAQWEAVMETVIDTELTEDTRTHIARLVVMAWAPFSPPFAAMPQWLQDKYLKVADAAIIGMRERFERERKIRDDALYALYEVQRMWRTHRDATDVFATTMERACTTYDRLCDEANDLDPLP